MSSRAFTWVACLAVLALLRAAPARADGVSAPDLRLWFATGVSAVVGVPRQPLHVQDALMYRNVAGVGLDPWAGRVSFELSLSVGGRGWRVRSGGPRVETREEADIVTTARRPTSGTVRGVEAGGRLSVTQRLFERGAYALHLGQWLAYDHLRMLRADLRWRGSRTRLGGRSSGRRLIAESDLAAAEQQLRAITQHWLSLGVSLEVRRELHERLQLGIVSRLGWARLLRPPGTDDLLQVSPSSTPDAEPSMPARLSPHALYSSVMLAVHVQLR